MTIKKNKIRTLDPYTRVLPQGSPVIVAITDPDREQLIRLGFSNDLSNGETILPPPVFGPVSRFNTNGKEIIHRDRPMETAYRTAEWSWNEWHGRDRVERSDFVDVPYKRYPRTHIPPPSIELTLTTNVTGSRVLASPEIFDWENRQSEVLHIVNLLLEIFGECSFFDSKMNQLIKTRIKRLNWEILPPGLRPWPRLKTELQSILSDIPQGKRIVSEHRLEIINGFEPDFTAVGRAGFRGYVILGFTNRNLFALESLFYGNATYVFGDEWEDLSRKTKAEILQGNLQKDRIIHLKGWEKQVRQLLQRPNVRKSPS